VILGMVWILISKFAIEDISEEQATAKEGLLLWCKKKTKGYKGCNVQNFNMSFQDGLAFAALIHKHRPDLIDYDGLVAGGDPMTTLNTAFDVAEQEFGIAKLLDAEDMVSIKPDEKSVMTYVAYYWKAFQQYAQAEVAARRVGNMVGRERALDEKRINFEEDSEALKNWIEQKQAFFAAKDVGNTSEEVANSLAGLKDYQDTEKPPKGAEKTRVEQHYNAFQARLKAENRPAYSPPAGLHPQDLDKVWMSLALAEREYERACRIAIAELNKADSKLKSFGLKVDNLIAWTDKKKQYCDEDVPTDSLDQITVATKKHQSFNQEKDAYMEFVTRTKDLGEKLRPVLSDSEQVDAKLAELDEAFAALNDASAARVVRMEEETKRQEQMDENRMVWVQQAVMLVLKIEDTKNELSGEVSANSVDELETLQADFKAYKDEAAGSVKSELDELNMFTLELAEQGVTENQYAQYDYEDIVALVAEMDAAFDTREGQIAEEADRQEFLESIRIEFAEHAKSFLEILESTNSTLTATYGEQLKTAKGASKEGGADVETLIGLTAPFNDYDFSELDALMEQIVECNDKMIEYKVGDNPHSSHTANELALEYQNTRNTTIKYAEDIERIMASSTDTSLTDEELAEMQAVFKHFDKNKSGSLGVHEVMAALRAVDVEMELDQVEALVAQYDNSKDGTIEWDEFVQIVVEQRTDDDTPEQIQESFKELAQNRDTIVRASQKHDYMSPPPPPLLLLHHLSRCLVSHAFCVFGCVALT
jgi:actinin alpha